MSICQAEKGFGGGKSVKKLPRPWTAKSGTAREDITDEWYRNKIKFKVGKLGGFAGASGW